MRRTAERPLLHSGPDQPDADQLSLQEAVTSSINARFEEILDNSQIVTDPVSGKRKIEVSLKKPLLLSALMHLGIGLAAHNYDFQPSTTDGVTGSPDVALQLPERPNSLQYLQERRQVSEKRESARDSISEQLRREAAEYITTTVKQYFPEDQYTQTEGLIVDESVYFRIDAYERALQKLSYLDKVPNIAEVQAEVDKLQAEMQQRYNERLDILLDDNAGQWTGDPIIDYPRLQAAMFLGENRFFYNSQLSETQYQRSSANAYSQLYSGYINCTVARFTPSLLQDIYLAEGLPTNALAHVGIVTWSDHVEAGYLDNENSEYSTFYFMDNAKPVLTGTKKFGHGADGIYLPANEMLRYHLASNYLANDEAVQAADVWTTHWYNLQNGETQSDTAVYTDSGATFEVEGHNISKHGMDNTGLVRPITIFANDEPEVVTSEARPMFSEETPLTNFKEQGTREDVEPINLLRDMRSAFDEISGGVSGHNVGAIFIPEWTAWPEAYELLTIVFSKEQLEAADRVVEHEYIADIYAKMWTVAKFSKPHSELRSIVAAAKTHIYEMSPETQKVILQRLIQRNYNIVREDFTDLYVKHFGIQPIEALSPTSIVAAVPETYLKETSVEQIMQRLERIYPELQAVPAYRAKVSKRAQELQTDLVRIFNSAPQPAEAGILLLAQGALSPELYQDYVDTLSPAEISAIVAAAFPIITPEQLQAFYDHESGKPGEYNMHNIELVLNTRQYVKYFFDLQAEHQAFKARCSAEDWLQIFRSAKSVYVSYTSGKFDFLPYIDAVAAAMEPEPAARFINEVANFYADNTFHGGSQFLSDKRILSNTAFRTNVFSEAVKRAYEQLTLKSQPTVSDQQEQAAILILGTITDVFSDVVIEDITIDTVLLADNLINLEVPYANQETLSDHLRSLYFEEVDQAKRLQLLSILDNYATPAIPFEQLYIEDRIAIEAGNTQLSLRLRYAPEAVSLNEAKFHADEMDARTRIGKLLAVAKANLP